MLNQDYREMLLCLQEEKVDFLIVGAYALAAHGNPRATGDIDIWIKADSDLLKNKLASNRDKDQSDIAWLKKNQG